MKYLLATALCLMLLASSCQKDNCHPFIRIKNLSEVDVINAIKVPGVEGCRLDGKLIAKGDSYDYYPFNSCIERSLSPNDTLVIYIVDIDGYNAQGVGLIAILLLNTIQY